MESEVAIAYSIYEIYFIVDLFPKDILVTFQDMI